MKRKIFMIFCLCFIAAGIAACGKTPAGGDLNKYIEMESVTGYYDGEEYTVDLPYFIDGDGNVLLQSENKNIHSFADKIKASTKEAGYKVEASCVLTGDSLISVRLKGSYDAPEGTDSDLWAANYNTADNTSSSIATSEFPNADSYQGWLQHYIRELFLESEGGHVRIYNFNIPYVYYIEDSKLMAAVTFTQLSDKGQTLQTALEVDITRGAEPYFSQEEIKNIDEMFFEPDGLPSSDLDNDDVNDEYAVKVTYWDSAANEFTSQLFALGQRKPSFPKLFNELNLTITYEAAANFGGDYTKVYTFTDERGYKNFVLKTQYWGEKEWESGIEEVCYVGVSFIDGIGTGTIRGSGSMSEEELLALYPHDLYLAGKIISQTHAALTMSNPSKAYIYKDPNDYNNRDLVFIVKDGQVISVDTAASYEYSRYDPLLGLSSLFSEKNDKASELKVKTASAFSGQFDVQEVLPDYVDADLLTGDDRIITIDMKVPQIVADVPGAAAINERIVALNPYAVRVARELNAGNLGVLAEGDLIGYLSMDYDVYTYKQAAALVVEFKGSIFHGGGGNVYLIVYYDCDTGNVMTVREYIAKCGISEESILAKCKEEEYLPSFPSDIAVKTIYDIKLAVQSTGQIMFYSEMGD